MTRFTFEHRMEVELRLLASDKIDLEGDQLPSKAVQMMFQLAGHSFAIIYVDCQTDLEGYCYDGNKPPIY